MCGQLEEGGGVTVRVEAIHGSGATPVFRRAGVKFLCPLARKRV